MGWDTVRSNTLHGWAATSTATRAGFAAARRSRFRRQAWKVETSRPRRLQNARTLNPLARNLGYGVIWVTPTPG
jgi:hypothetical protein